MILNSKTMRDHKKLRAFALTDDIAVGIYKITRSFPKEEMYGITSQMKRAAVSVVSNIVEGCARESQNEYRRFLEMAFGSLRELDYQFDLSIRLEFIEAKIDKTEILQSKLMKLKKSLVPCCEA